VGIHIKRLRGKGRDLPGAVKGPVNIGHVHERVELLGLLARQHEGLDAEDLANGVQPLILLQPLLAANFYTSYKGLIIILMYTIFTILRSRNLTVHERNKIIWHNRYHFKQFPLGVYGL
jgi:hypothetical protein